MSITITPTLQAVYASVYGFITGALGSTVPVIQGLSNRTPMPPPVPGFVLMQAIHARRLRWNIDSWQNTTPPPVTMTEEQALEVWLQLDFYGPTSLDYSTTISTLWRDEYGCNALAPTCQPLYADEARMIPLIDAEQQYEQRWSLDARLQYNPVTTITQAYAGSTQIGVVNVNQSYPAT